MHVPGKSWNLPSDHFSPFQVCKNMAKKSIQVFTSPSLVTALSEQWKKVCIIALFIKSLQWSHIHPLFVPKWKFTHNHLSSCRSCADLNSNMVWYWSIWRHFVFFVIYSFLYFLMSRQLVENRNGKQQFSVRGKNTFKNRSKISHLCWKGFLIILIKKKTYRNIASQRL